MKLVYDKNLVEVQIGDRGTLRDGKEYEVVRKEQPRNPASSGRVYVKEVGGEDFEMGYYPSVIDATWIEREDRPIETLHVYQDGKDFYIDEDQKNFFTEADKIKVQYKNGFAHYEDPDWVDDTEHATAARNWFINHYCVLHGYNAVFS